LTNTVLVRTTNLVKHFPAKESFFLRLSKKGRQVVHAVDGVSLEVHDNETFALVGESGSGKSTLGLLILRLIEPTSGEIIFQNKSILKLSERELKELRHDMQIVFQDPSSSLDPRKRIYDSVIEPLRAQGFRGKEQLWRRAAEALASVGLDESQMRLFPHEFSGGQRQRISIARSVILNPKFIVLDEPTSSLDASVQAQIIMLLLDLQKKLGLSFLLITHNISIARYMADRVAVMYMGQIVEIGSNQEVIGKPLHPYTRLLKSSILEPEHYGISVSETSANIPSPSNPPAGCRFNTRCPYAKEVCITTEPELRHFPGDHFVACHFAESFQQ